MRRLERSVGALSHKMTRNQTSFFGSLLEPVVFFKEGVEVEVEVLMSQ